MDNKEKAYMEENSKALHEVFEEIEKRGYKRGRKERLKIEQGICVGNIRAVGIKQGYEKGVADERNRIIKILMEHGSLEKRGYVQPIKPTHGICCTCQDCGYPNDNECVCDSNKLWKSINEVDKQ